MKIKITSLICSASLVMSPLGVQGQTNVTVPTAATGVESSGSTVPSVKNGADQMQNANNKAQSVNYLTGGAQIASGGLMINEGYSASPTSWGLVVAGAAMVAMGLQNVSQGDKHGDSAIGDAQTSYSTDGLGGTTYTPPTDSSNPYASVAKDDPNVKAIGSTLQTLQAKGVYDPKLGTFNVNGKTYAASDLSSPASMATSGLSQGAIAGLMSATADMEKKAQAKVDKVKIGASTAENGYADAGGGGNAWGTGSGSGASSATSSYGGVGKASLSKSALGRDPSSLAGMSKNYNGEPIGVAADSIFSMMSRRYKVKESQETFFGPADVSLQK
ncbi:MAG TPA: hypothetical protein VN132_09775 [Bdellovibrio sp.]|nr:hypothetical protein [Bdellovibrio sp.]